jgi:hypothetical protein
MIGFNLAVHADTRRSGRTPGLRHFYQGWRPTRHGRLSSRAYAWLAGLGLMPLFRIDPAPMPATKFTEPEPHP